MNVYKLFIVVLLFCSFTFCSCENVSVAQESTIAENIKEPTEAVTTSENMTEEAATAAPEPATDYIIEEQRAGVFTIGGAITAVAEAKGYSLEKRSMMAEGTEEPFYLVFEGGEPLLRVTPKYNMETGEFDDVVGRIMVLSTRYKMANGLGKGSTIKELQEMYADVKFWYTYIGAFYYASTDQSSVQFVLSDADFTGTQKEDKADAILLHAADFKQEGKIAGIRIF